MMKIKDHHRALTDYINATLGLPFEWGVRDCVTYAIGALESMIGMEGEKPEFTYRTREDAMEFAKSWRLKDGMIAQLNAYEVPHHFHQPGDIAIVERDGLECAHVVFDRRAYAPLLGDRVRPFNMKALYEECPDVKILRFD
jgi:hypothetical protein